MSSIEGRIEALERSAKLIADQTPPALDTRSVDEFRRKIDELLSRPRPEKTQEEVILEFKAYAERRRIEFELQYAKSHVRGRTV